MSRVKTSRTFLVAAAFALGVCTSATANGEGMSVWPVDPHVKVFRDLEPAPTGTVSLRAARNEHEPVQVSV